MCASLSVTLGESAEKAFFADTSFKDPVFLLYPSLPAGQYFNIWRTYFHCILFSLCGFFWGCGVMIFCFGCSYRQSKKIPQKILVTSAILMIFVVEGHWMVCSVQVLLTQWGCHCGKMFFCSSDRSQVFLVLQEGNGGDLLNICTSVLLVWIYLFAIYPKMSLTVLRTSAAKVNCKLKYYKVLGGLDESSHKICFHALSVFVRIRACIHINLWPEWVFWVFSMVVSSCGTLSQVSVPSSAPVEGKAMESQNLRCQGTMLECSHLFL